MVLRAHPIHLCPDGRGRHAATGEGWAYRQIVSLKGKMAQAPPPPQTGSASITLEMSMGVRPSIQAGTGRFLPRRNAGLKILLA